MVAGIVKKKLGVYEFSSCAGCQVEFLNLDLNLLELGKKFEFTHSRFLGLSNPDARVDVALCEGAVTTRDEEELLKKVRGNAGVLVAFGTCACFGGVPAIKDYHTPEQLEKMVYGEDIPFESLQAKALDELVRVDYYLRGCPIDGVETLRVLGDLRAGKTPLSTASSVCFECKLKENKCLFYEQPCMGSVIDGGCRARCPSQGVACFACRGPMDDANNKVLFDLLKQSGVGEHEAKNLFRLFVTKKRFEERLTEHGL